LIIAVNTGTASATTNLDTATLSTQPKHLVYGSGEFEWYGEQLSLTLPPRTGCILG
jgi:hypothetical protein